MLSALSFEVLNQNNLVVVVRLNVGQDQEPKLLKGLISSIRCSADEIEDLADLFPEDSRVINALAHLISEMGNVTDIEKIDWSISRGHFFSFRLG